MSRRSVLVCLALIACDTHDANGTATDGGTDASTTADTTEPAICSELLGRARTTLADAVARTPGPAPCTTDDECFVVFAGISCMPTCGPRVGTTKEGAAQLQAVVDKTEAEICSAFASNKCHSSTPSPCPPPSPRVGTTCLHNVCQNFPPANWVSFAFQHGYASTKTPPPSCDSGGTCTLHMVTPDARLVLVNPDRTVTLSASDFATVDQILRSESFRGHPGSECPPTSDAPQMQFLVQRGLGTGGFDATDCLTGSGDVAKLWTIVSSY